MGLHALRNLFEVLMNNAKIIVVDVFIRLIDGFIAYSFELCCEDVNKAKEEIRSRCLSLGFSKSQLYITGWRTN